jgi:thiamine kinase
MKGADEWVAAESSARAALATHPSTALLADVRLTAIDSGLSNFAWRAAAGDERRFVRLARVGSEGLGADLYAEARILHLVSAAGIAPQVMRCDPVRRLLVTQWIEPGGGPSSFDEPALVETVAQLLARLHAQPAPGDLRVVRFDAQARTLEAALPASVSASELLAGASDVFARLAQAPAPPVLCHHDLHAENMLFDADGRLWLVDWEYAGLNDPVFDLASFASQCALPEAATRALCAAYVQAGGAVDERRLELAQWAFDYVQWLWYQGWSAAPNAGRGQREAALRSARIERSLLERASVLLRCNNHRFDQSITTDG